ncbi:MAG: FMN-binding protein [Tissierellia bacterium]|nr:FMN-binding protein [Tissierellia bacterium]
MKRKLGFSILSIVLVLVLLVGCSGQGTETSTDENDSQSETSGELVDGTYLVKDPVSDRGNYPMAIMEVVDGEISSFEYVEILADLGEEKNESNYNYAEGLAVIANLNEQFNEKKDINQVDFDAVTGATHTKENFKRIVNELLDKAAKGEAYEPVYKDGVYTATAEEPSHGWLGEVKIVVKHGQIVGLDYYEYAVEDMEGSRVVFDEDDKPVTGDDGKPVTEEVQISAGDRKSKENYAYLDSLEVMKKMQKLIIDNNGLDNLDVDSVTGATSTRTTIIELVEKALDGAKL